MSTPIDPDQTQAYPVSQAATETFAASPGPAFTPASQAPTETTYAVGMVPLSRMITSWCSERNRSSLGTWSGSSGTRDSAARLRGFTASPASVR